ncbi:MAG: glycosyltransferase [Syntrophales bacterium]
MYTSKISVSFVVAVNCFAVYNKNFLASPCLKEFHRSQILTFSGYKSASAAYNEGIRCADHDLIIFAHQDVFLPEAWFYDLERSLSYLEETDPSWGVLGCYGITENGLPRGHLYTTGWGIIGEPLSHPEEVKTLDEVLLIVKKSSGLRFDDALPHFHFYGTDICMAAAERNMKCYAVPAFLIHNTDQILFLPKDFYDCYYHIKKRWKRFLPIQTSCIKITKFDMPIYERKLREWYSRVLHSDRFARSRSENPAAHWEGLKKSHPEAVRELSLFSPKENSPAGFQDNDG